MKTLLKNAILLSGSKAEIAIEDKIITYIGEKAPEEKYDETVDCRGGLVMPGLYNIHTHAAMTLFRGYGEDLPLQEWLNDRIFPAEDRLTNKSVYDASMLACAEMIRSGTVGFTDMYFFCDQTCKAAVETGLKANISRCIVSFDPTEDFANDYRFSEAKALFAEYHNAADGRIKIDSSIHAEYTNVTGMVRAVADYSAKVGARVQLHLSETEKEHMECIARHGVTPARFFADNGLFDVPVTAAHCVWVSEEDMMLLREKGVTVAHNPNSNLKLGSGIAPVTKMMANGLNIGLGTDGTASNNRLDIFREMYTAAILHKGATRDPSMMKAEEVIAMATRNGAIAQGRYDSGRLEKGCRADVILVDLDSVNNVPCYEPKYAAVYSTDSNDVRMTMVDGKILYLDGEYRTLDIEKVKYEMRNTVAHYFD